MAILSGSTGFLKLGSTAYAFDKWKLSMKAGSPNVTNFTSAGYRQIVLGIISGSLTCSGPYNNGSMALVMNTSYVFHLGFDTGVELSVTATVTGIEVDNNVEDAPRINIAGEVSGSFTSSVT
jgi:hypothetical protein